MKNKPSISSSSFFNSKLTVTISISLVLFLLGLIVLLALFTHNLSNYVKENLSFDIVLSEDMPEAQIHQMQKQLEATVFAKSVDYISKADAAKELEEELGQNMEEFLGFNPLPPILVVHLNAQYAHVDSLQVIEKQIYGFSTDIKNIEYRKELMQMVNENLTKVSFVLLGAVALLLFISFALINNTIRLMIYSKRFLIHTMKLVGATSGFIRHPFIRAGIIQGIVASFIAIGLIAGLSWYITNDLQELIRLISPEYFGIVFGCILILGISISYIATYFAVNKYIRIDRDKLFYL